MGFLNFLGLIVGLIFAILISALLVVSAKAKDYNPFAWVLAGGFLELVILAFLPDLTVEDLFTKRGSRKGQSR